MLLLQLPDRILAIYCDWAFWLLWLSCMHSTWLEYLLLYLSTFWWRDCVRVSLFAGGERILINVGVNFVSNDVGEIWDNSSDGVHITELFCMFFGWCMCNNIIWFFPLSIIQHDTLWFEVQDFIPMKLSCETSFWMLSKKCLSWAIVWTVSTKLYDQLLIAKHDDAVGLLQNVL